MNLLFLALFHFLFPASAIIGGEEVHEADPVYQSTASLGKVLRVLDDGTSGVYMLEGSGTIIDDDLFLTAAHCFQPHLPNRWQIIFGGGSFDPSAAKRRVVSAKRHSSYPKDWSRDIALMRFEGGIPEGFKKMRLVKSGELLKSGTIVTVAGFGINDFEAYEKRIIKPPLDLRSLGGRGTLRWTENEITEANYGETEFITDESQGKAACKYDSGGPIYHFDSVGIYLYGIIHSALLPLSGIHRCDWRGKSLRIEAFLEWIRKTAIELRDPNKRIWE